MTTWPAIIKFEADDELFFIADAAQWNSDRDLCGTDYHSSDILIDAAGAIHHLNHQSDGKVTPQSTKQVMELSSAIELVKAHFSAIGACCSAKLSARTFEELFEMVGASEAHK
ncbi:DUF4144 domain-containing protein [Psychrobium sp. MM17-31]|uniref:DUF4144 domain-containing protein n=1 Tax=Psychrobium sp. MM17-31 TaxID=2917758 RepID=UPI001EF5AF17|nr:DUF4144 domain-containing protein [Psychrobium sp. MM17-31]